MYSKEESFLLVSAQSSKISSEENCLPNNNDYPTYDDRKEVLNLIEAGSSVLETPIKKEPDPQKTNTYREDEIWALVNNSYDPRNYGRVKSAPKKIGTVRVQESVSLVSAVA